MTDSSKVQDKRCHRGYDTILSFKSPHHFERKEVNHLSFDNQSKPKFSGGKSRK